MANKENKRAAAAFLLRVTFYPTGEDTAGAIADMDFGRNLSAMSLAGRNVQKEFMPGHEYTVDDFNIEDAVAPEFAQHAPARLTNRKTSAEYEK